MPQAAYVAVAEWAVAAGYTAETAALLGSAAYVGTAVAISYAAQQVLAPSANKVTPNTRIGGPQISNDQGVIGGSALATSITQSDAPRRLVYGTVKTGGVVAYTKKTPNERYLHRAIYLGEGPILGIGPGVWVGDQVSTEAPLAGHVTAEVFTGAAGQGYSASLAAVSEGEWTAAMVGNGCAWVHCTYEWDLDAFRTGAPFPAFLVYGRLCYDPRTGASAHTSNPALILLDFIRSEFGYGHPDAWIDFDTFAAAANICDEVVVSRDADNVVDGVPGRVRRYSCNAVFETDAGPAKTVQAILDTCAGALVFSGGKYRLYVGAYRAPTGPSLTAEYLRADPMFRPHPARTQRFNICRGTYMEPKQDWQMVDLGEQVLSAAIVAEDGEIVQPLTLPAVTNGAQAQRLARIAMNTARSATPLILRCNFAAFTWRLYDVVTVALPEMGAEGAFLITGYKYADIADGGGIDLTLVPHLASDFAWDPTTMETLVESVPTPNWDYPAPDVEWIGLSVRTDFYSGSDQVDRVITARWIAPDWVITSHYELQVKRDDEDWVTYQVSETRWAVDASPESEYAFRVRVVGINGKVGDWSSTLTETVYRDTSAPGSPTGISVGGDYGHTVSWYAPTSSNFALMRIYTVTGPGLGGANEIGSVAGRPGSRGYATFLNPAGTHYAIAPESVDGVVGSLVYAGEGSTDAGTYVQPQIDALDARVTDLESGP